MSIAVDIDETIIDTSRRRWVVWRQVLDRDIPYEAIRKSYSAGLPAGAIADDDMWYRFWSLMLCTDERGIELLSLDKPYPHAPEVLKRWSVNHEIVYFTGRPANMYDLTSEELREFGFPNENTDLVMLNLKDSWKWFIDFSLSLQYRSKLFSKVDQKHKVLRVIEDYAPFFSVYKKFEIPERIGILSSKKHQHQEYFYYGATKVVKNWKEMDTLQNILNT